MKTFKNNCKSILALLVDSPVLCFFPYIPVYLLGWFLNIPLSIVANCFWLIHLLNLFVVCSVVFSYFRQVKILEWLFWSLLFLVLWNRGAYLEYPSDPWDHFRRLTLWNDYTFIAENPFKARIPYFFGWTFLKYFEPLNQRSFLNFYSAFWQWLLSYQFARLFLKLGISRNRIPPFVIGTLVFFGCGMLSFRYYMLSGVPLGYMAYLAAISLFLTPTIRVNLGLALQLFIFTFLMLMGHPETCMFFMVSFTALLFSRIFFEKKRDWKFYLILFSMYILSLLVGYLIYEFDLITFNIDRHRTFWTSQMSRFTTFRIWNLNAKFFETIAIPGLIGLLSSVFFLKKYPRIVVLSIFPVFLLVFPPAVFLIVKTFHYDATYRILYAFPVGILIVLLLEHLVRQIRVKEAFVSSVTCILVLLIAAPYAYPWRGRLFFQIHRPKALRTLVHLDNTAQWFYENRKNMPRECQIIGDDLSLFSLYSHLGKRKLDYDRPNPLHFFKTTDFHLNELVQKIIGLQMRGRTTCGILIARKKEIPPPAFSHVSTYGRLWPPQRGDLNEFLSDAIYLEVPKLIKRGWTISKVPPFYDLYEPPYLNDLPPPLKYSDE